MRIFKRRKRTPRLDTTVADVADTMAWAQGFLAGRRSDRQTDSQPRSLDAVVDDLARAPLTGADVTYGGYLPMCPHCRTPLSERDVRRFSIGLASNRSIGA